MNLQLQKVSEEALSLTPNDRAALAHIVIQSLDTDQECSFDEEWKTEIVARDNRLKTAHTTEKLAFDVLNEIREKLS